MSKSIYDRPSDAIMANARKHLEFALQNDRDFQNQIANARVTASISFEEAMTLGHAALMLADASPLHSFGLWCRESAVILFCRAYDAVALQREAERARAGAGLN